MRSYFCALVREEYEYRLDHLSGHYKYFLKRTGESFYNKPLLLRNQPLDCDHIPSWDIAEVCLFLRRIGLGCYQDNIKTFTIDGFRLIQLDEKDFRCINITNSLHVLKIKLEMERRCPDYTKLRSKILVTSNQSMKRDLELLNRQLRMVYILQRACRTFLKRNREALNRRMELHRKYELEERQRREASGVWWLDGYKKLPKASKSRVSYRKELVRAASRSPLPANGWRSKEESIWCLPQVTSNIRYIKS